MSGERDGAKGGGEAAVKGDGEKGEGRDGEGKEKGEVEGEGEGRGGEGKERGEVGRGRR